MFSVRLVVADHYVASPIPGLDPGDPTLGDPSASPCSVPVIRIFGSTFEGQKRTSSISYSTNWRFGAEHLVRDKYLTRGPLTFLSAWTPSPQTVCLGAERSEPRTD